ncbi:DUF4175 domain-containing protein [Sulfurimonas sediminis]|uniref:DUF4175 domain-containing protein n=1 Tax=Sulfurimonas sediminis TaxID=2590020 RepID=A0A7M1AY99_9BACT|nr:hypothetical protein [Sulfurimonas sediminis]QOP42449.1 DUF4175 domain-containing protein [Sulfurimonas sediminis]
MKLVKITLSVALLGLLSIASAEDVVITDTTVSTAPTEETVSTDTTVDIDAQIEAIQSAPEQERVELMNEFKQRLMQMNQEERMAAIQEMQSKMQAEAGTMNESGTRTAEMSRNMMQTRDQEHVQEMQLQTNENMNQVQNMIQQQAGSQYMQTVGTSEVTGTTSIPSMNAGMMRRR